MVCVTQLIACLSASEVLLKQQALRVQVNAAQIRDITNSQTGVPMVLHEPGPVTIESWVEGYPDIGFRSMGKSAYSLVFFGSERPQPASPIRIDTGECNRVFFDFARKQNRNEITYTEAYRSWDAYGQSIVSLNNFFSGYGGSAEERIAWSRAEVRDGPFLNGTPGLKLPLYFQGPAGERGTTYAYLKFPEVSMSRVGDRTIRLKVTDINGDPVAGERVHLECLAYGIVSMAADPSWDVPGWFRQRLDYMLTNNSGARTNTQLQETFLSRNPSLLVEDYFGSVLADTVFTNQEGEAEFEVEWPLYRWRVWTWGNRLTDGTDGRIRILACTDRGYLGLFTSDADDSSAGSTVTLEHRLPDYTDGRQEIYIPRRVFRDYTLEGQIVDSVSGIPLADVTVETTVNGQPFSTSSDSDGWYQLPITFSTGQGTATDLTPVSRFELEPIGLVVECSKYQYRTIRRFLPTLDREQFTLQGTVTNARTGEPIPGAYIRTDNQSVTSNNDGTYMLEYGGGGQVLPLDFAFDEAVDGSLRAEKSGMQAGSVSLEITPDSRISGQVLFRGFPVNEATVSVQNTFANVQVSTKSDADGRYTLVLGDGTQDADAAPIHLSSYSTQALADVTSQKDRLSGRSDTVLYHYFDMQAVEEFLTHYPEALASAPETDVDRIQKSAVRLANVLLHLYQLDNLAQDYADRILDTLGALFSDLLEKTDLIAQITELPGEGPGQEIADELLEEVRESLNKMTRNFVSALGYAMSGPMPEALRDNTRKFLDSLRQNGADAFKIEMREALLAHALRSTMQAQMNEAARRCRALEFSGDGNVQKDLAYQHLAQQFEGLKAFIESVNWQELVNTSFQSLEETAGYAKHLGTPVGWRHFIEMVEKGSGVLSKALSGAGAAQAMSAFGLAANQVPILIQLDLGDLTQAPAMVISELEQVGSQMTVSQFAPLQLGDEHIQPYLPQTEDLLNRIVALRESVLSQNQNEILAQASDYLIAWRNFERGLDAEIRHWHLADGNSTNASNTTEPHLSASNTHQAVLAVAMQHAWRLIGLSRGIEETDFEEWTLLLDVFASRVREADQSLSRLSSAVDGSSDLGLITGIEFPGGPAAGGSLVIRVTVTNPSLQTMENLTLAGRNSTYLTFPSGENALPPIPPGESATTDLTASLQAITLHGYGLVDIQLMEGGMEHDRLQSTLPTRDFVAPTGSLLWPPNRQRIPALDGFAFRIQDNRSVEGLRIVSLVLGGEVLDVEDLSIDPDGFLIIPMESNATPASYAGQLIVADAAGNEGTTSFQFLVGPSTYPVFGLLNEAMPWFNPSLSNAQWEVWAAPSTDLKFDMYQEGNYTAIPALSLPSTAGRQSLIWDGRDAAGEIAASGTYTLMVRTPSNNEILKRSIHLLTEECPISELRLVKSELAQEQSLVFAVNMKETGNVACKYNGFQFATFTLKAGFNFVPCSPMDRTGNLVTQLSLPLELEFVDADGQKLRYFLKDSRIAREPPPAVYGTTLTDTAGSQLDAGIPLGSTARFNVTTSGTEKLSAFLVIRDNSGKTVFDGPMSPATDGLVFYADWSTSGHAVAEELEWVAQIVDDSGQSAQVKPQGFYLTDSAPDPVTDVDGDGMPDDWEAANGGDLLPGQDMDQDGADNYSEYLGGTDPNDPLSRLIIRIQKVGNEITMEWESQHLRLYRVWSRQGLGEETDWQLEAEMSNAPAEGRLDTLFFPMNDDHRFYRIEVLMDTH
jgi:hypothetical protein